MTRSVLPSPNNAVYENIITHPALYRLPSPYFWTKSRDLANQELSTYQQAAPSIVGVNADIHKLSTNFRDICVASHLGLRTDANCMRNSVPKTPTHRQAEQLSLPQPHPVGPYSFPSYVPHPEEDQDRTSLNCKAMQCTFVDKSAEYPKERELQGQIECISLHSWVWWSLPLSIYNRWFNTK